MVKHFNISISEKTERKWRGEFHQKQENFSVLKKNMSFYIERVKGMLGTMNEIRPATNTIPVQFYKAWEQRTRQFRVQRGEKRKFHTELQESQWQRSLYF